MTTGLSKVQEKKKQLFNQNLSRFLFLIIVQVASKSSFHSAHLKSYCCAAVAFLPAINT